MCYFVFPRGRVGHGGKGRGGDGLWFEVRAQSDVFSCPGSSIYLQKDQKTKICWFEVRAQSDVNLKLREDIHSTGNDSTGKSS